MPSQTETLLTLPLTRLTDPNGNAWQFERNDKHVLTRLVETSRETPTGRVVECIADTYPDKLGQLTLIDAAGNITPLIRYQQDKYGDLIAVIDAMERPYSFEYQPAMGISTTPWCVVSVRPGCPPLRNTPAETTWFIWDGDAMVGEVKHRMQGADNPAGANTHRWEAQFYSYHLGSFVPLAMQVQAPEDESVGKKLYFYQNDPNGMPLRLLVTYRREASIKNKKIQY